jgi:hypothetical protein
MKISGDKLIEVYHTWLKDYFSNVRLTSSKVNWLKLPLAKNAPVSPTTYLFPISNIIDTVRLPLMSGEKTHSWGKIAV